MKRWPSFDGIREGTKWKSKWTAGACVPNRAWLLFNTCFSSLVLCVSVAATLQLPIGKVAWPILIFCGLLGLVLTIKLTKSASKQSLLLPGAAAVLLVLGAVVFVLWGSLIKDEFVSVFPDPWSYSAHATDLLKTLPPDRAQSQLILAHGSQLAGTRYATPGLLALFAEATGTDPCRSANLYAFIVLAHLGVGLVLLARMLGAGPIFSLGSGLFGVMIGWAPEVLKIGNWDQLLFMSLIPFAIFRTRLLTFSTSRPPGIVALGLCLAAAICAYPEGTAIAGVIYLPLVAWRLCRGSPILGKVRRFVLAAGVAILLSLVYLPTFVSFLAHQLSAGHTALVAKGALGGLLSPNWLAAAYCLGAQLPATTAHPPRKLDLIVSALFVVLSFVATAAWWRRRDGILLTIPFFLALSLWEALRVQYDYGLYKVLTMFWPIMVVAIFAGMSKLLARCQGLARLFAVLGFCGLVAGAVFDEVDDFRYAPWRQARSIKPFLELSRLKEISGDSPIRLQTQSWFNQLWAVFFLQSDKLIVPNPLLYLQSLPSSLVHPSTAPEERSFTLTDEKRPGAIWRNQIFYLLAHAEPVELLAVNAPNTLETVEGEPYLWLDNQFADLTIHSDADRLSFLIVAECRPGPNRPEDSKRTLLIEQDGVTVEVPAEGSLKIPLRLKKGDNLVRLACKEPATLHTLPSGDSRTLLLGIKGFRVTPATGR
jgi:hypothetical protein